MEYKQGVNIVVRDRPFFCNKCGEIVKANTESMAFKTVNGLVLNSHIVCKKNKAKKKIRKRR